MSEDFVKERERIVGLKTCLFITLRILFFIYDYLLHFIQGKIFRIFRLIFRRKIGFR